MNKEQKEQTITFGELKKTKISVSKKYVEELLRTRVSGDKVEIHLKDLVSKILVTTPEKNMTLPDGKEVRTSYSEIFDQDGKPIEGITAIQAFNGAIIVATANKMYCNKPEIFKTSSSFEEVATPEKKCCFNCGIGSDGCTNKDCSCHQEKLPTSSYEVTCGRCEKSISHKCGRVCSKN